MKNTLKQGRFRIVIYKEKDKYISICYETGWVEEWETLEEAKKHILSGLLSLMETVASGNLSEQVMNQKPPLKYRFLFFSFAIASIFKWFNSTFFIEPVPPLRFSNS